MSFTDSDTEPVVHSILVAEDEPHIARIIKIKLEQGPYEVHCVGDGRSALQAVERGDFSLVLLDIMMPHMSGLEVLSHLRAQGYSKPIVVLTAKGQAADRRQALELGADAFFTKPFSPKELLTAIGEILAIDQARLPIKRCMQLNEELRGEIERLKEQVAALHEEQGQRGAPAGEITNAVVGSVAHSLKGELANVAFRIDLLKMQDPSPGFLSSFEVMERSLAFSHLLIQNLVSHVELGHHGAKPLNLSAQAVRAVQLMRDRVPANITLELNGAEDGPPVWTRGDAEQVLSVLVELVRNAAKAIGEEEGAIVVSVRCNDREAKVEVQDNGPGVPPDLLELLGRQPVVSRRGHGIGLYLIDQTLRQMNGTLAIESGPGGTRVTATLPREDAGGRSEVS